MRTTLTPVLIATAALLLVGCADIQLPTTEGGAQWDPVSGKPVAVNYKSTKAQAGFNAEVDPSTGKISVSSDNADSPRGYEDFIKAQMMVELERLKTWRHMFDKAMEAAAKGAPGPGG